MILNKIKKMRKKNNHLTGKEEKHLEKSSFIATKRHIDKTYSKEKTIVKINDKIAIGGNILNIMAGPCSVESKNQIMETAKFVKAYGGTILRGGCFKPRTSPYDFQGLGEEGLKLLSAAGKKYDLPIITEVMDTADVEIISSYADILQIGSRNALNYSLLKKVGKTKKPILLKRGLMMTIKELLMAAEYIMSEGNMNVILCERGIRTFESETRNTLDISAIPILKEKTHLPVIVDPSHASGKESLVLPLSLAAIAAGADGLIIECHNNPDNALCDGAQSLNPLKFQQVISSLSAIANASNKTM
jgi:3-deoxy-7-phosphoheptulonate synthase